MAVKTSQFSPLPLPFAAVTVWFALIASGCEKSANPPTRPTAPASVEVPAPAAQETRREQTGKKPRRNMVEEERIRGALREIDHRLRDNPADAEAYFDRGMLRRELRRHLSAPKRIESLMESIRDFEQAHDVAGGDWLVDPHTDRTLTPAESAELPTDDKRNLVGFDGIRRDPDGVLIFRPPHGEARRVGGPGMASALAAAARAWMRLYQIDEARDCYERARVIDPDLIDVRAVGATLRGHADGNWVAVARELEDLLKRAEGDSIDRIRFSLAVSYSRADRADESERLYRSILKDDPDNSAARNNLGLLLVNQGRAEEGIETLGSALTADPQQVYAMINLASALLGEDRPGEALVAIDNAIEITPPIPAAWLNKCSALIGLKRYAEAEEACRQAIRFVPQYIDAYHNLSVLYSKCARHDEAVKSLQTALKLQPGSIGTIQRLGEVLETAGRHKEAEVAFRQWVAIRPSDPGSHVALGVVLEGQRKFDDAMRSYEKALELDPKNSNAINNIAFLKFTTGDFDAAEAGFRRALEMNPSSMVSVANLRNVLIRQARWDEARRVVDAAVRAEPGHADVYGIRGGLHAARGDEASAIEDFNRAIGIDPDESDGYFFRAVSELKMGRFADAVGDLRVVVENDFNNATAPLLLFLFLKDMGQEDQADRVISRAVDRTAPRSWEGRLVRYYSGELSQEDLLNEIAVGDDGHACEAYYYIGERVRLERGADASSSWFTKATRIGMTDYLEHGLAAWRLAKH